MRPKRVDKVQVDVTPSELRELADQLQAMWDRSKVGDNVPSVTIYGDECELVFRIDQEEMHSQEYRRKMKEQHGK